MFYHRRELQDFIIQKQTIERTSDCSERAIVCDVILCPYQHRPRCRPQSQCCGWCSSVTEGCCYEGRHEPHWGAHCVTTHTHKYIHLQALWVYDCSSIERWGGNSHVTSEPAEVIVGVFTLNSALEALKGHLCCLDTKILMTNSIQTAHKHMDLCLSQSRS